MKGSGPTIYGCNSCRKLEGLKAGWKSYRPHRPSHRDSSDEVSVEMTWRIAVTVFALVLAVSPGAIGVGKYSRTVSYEGQVLVRCPDRTKDTVQVLIQYLDVWGVGEESIDLRMDKKTHERIQNYIPECFVLVGNLEAHVQEAENSMFPAQKAEEDKWVKAVIEELLPTKQSLAECEQTLERVEAQFQRSESWFEEYHNYGAICSWYQRLASDHPNLVRHVPSIGKTGQGRDMPAVHITANSSSSPDRKKVYFQCLIHAREWVSGAVCMYISNHLVQNYGSNVEVTALLDSMEFVIVPIVNPDGYVFSWTSDRLWRKNRVHTSSPRCIGVDINRNFPTGWRRAASASYRECAEDYGGPSVGSELETQHIVNYFRENGPFVGAIDWHSHGQLILRPWGWSGEDPPGAQLLQTLGEQMSTRIRQVHNQHYISERSIDLYACYGIASDWFHGDDAARTNGGYRAVAYVIELRDQGIYGFLLPADQIIPTGEEVVPAALHFAETLLQTPIRYHDNSTNQDTHSS